MGIIKVQWVSGVSGRRLLATAPSSTVTFVFNTLGLSQGWAAIGFDLTNYRMTGSKKSVILQVDGTSCFISFCLLVDWDVQPVDGVDPWGLQPSACTVVGNAASVDFIIGGSSSITLPPQGTSMYTLLAGGNGVGLGNHGSKWDFKRIDYLSATGASQNSGPGAVVNPFYLSHGIMFIINFCLLMPLTGFLILINKARYTGVHKWLGLIIISVLAAGWIVLSFADPTDTDYSPLSNQSELGLEHSTYGRVGVWLAVGVCSVGVILWAFWLPAKIKFAVRFLHGLAGVGLSFFGPWVVWTGWLRLAPAAIDILDSTPWVWLAIALLFGTIVVLDWLVGKLSGRTDTGTRYKGDKNHVFTESQVDSLVRQGHVLLIVEGRVCELPKNFVHPGGRSVLEKYIGKEVGPILRGIAPGHIKGRNRMVSHSSEAFMLVERMQIGTVLAPNAPPEVVVVDMSSPATPIDRRTRTIATLVGREQLNSAEDFPVMRMQFRVNVLSDLGSQLNAGSRIYISVQKEDGSRTERPYTTIGVKEKERIIEFAIKIYPQGELTSKLGKLEIGTSVSFSHAIAHPPIPSIPRLPTLVIFIAGGTGITPMWAYFDNCAKRVALGGVLLWWVRHEHDLFLVDHARPNSIPLKVYCTQPQEVQVALGTSVKRRKSLQGAMSFGTPGRISGEKILEAFGASALPIDPRDVAVIMSGPDGFVETANAAVLALGIPEERILCLD